MKNLKILLMSGALIGILAIPFVSSASTVDDIKNQINNLLQQVLQLQQQIINLSDSPLPTITPTPTIVLLNGNCPVLTYNLYMGITDNETEGQVTNLQNYLAQYSDIYPEGLVTGYFGPLTETAVKKFQCKYNVVCSGSPEATGYGVVGPMTRSKIKELCGNLIPTPTLSPTPTPTPTLIPTPTPLILSKCISPLPSPLPAAGSSYAYSSGIYKAGRFYPKGSDNTQDWIAITGGSFEIKEDGGLWYAFGIPSQFGTLKPDGNGGHTFYNMNGKLMGTMMLYRMPATHIGREFNEQMIIGIARYTPVGESDFVKPYNEPHPEYGAFYGPLGVVRVGENGDVRDDYNIIYRAKRNPGNEGGFAIYDLNGNLVAILGADFSRDNLLTYTVIKNFVFPNEYCLKYL